MIALPRDFGITFDRSVHSYDGGRLLLGGTPLRAMRVTTAGRKALDALCQGTEESEAARLLARRLVDAGMAHPRPPRATGPFDVTVVVPVRDRPTELERCLAALGSNAPIIVVDDGSVDADAVSSICARYGSTLIRVEPGKGAAAARNTGLARVESEFVAFIDSDCVASSGWLDSLANHFSDPLVGAVAPRIRPVSLASPASVLSRFTAARSPLDLGDAEGAVRPGGRVPYVPTAALVIRRAALARAFDPELRYGEDVDLVWRLHDAGWRVRYVPDVAVAHVEPSTWLGVLRRRFNYGTSAAPLSHRHPGRLAHAILSPWPTTVTALLLGRRPKSAVALGAVHGALLARRSHGNCNSPAQALQWSAASVGHTARGAGHAATMFLAPALLAALGSRSTRGAALILLAATPTEEWVRRQPRLDPLRWAAACIVDDVAYGAGVWHGCAAHRTIKPLLPVTSPTVKAPLQALL